MSIAPPYIPDSAPFTAEQRSWLNGFLAAIFSGQATEVKEPLLILFGSQSGNAESLAKKLGKQAATCGFAPRVVGLDAFQPVDLTKERNVMLITSTWGEGEMPDNANSFWNALNEAGSSLSLQGVRYSVLALGDMNYADTFCLAGRKLDQRFTELGATAMHPRVDCDVDFDAPAKLWSEALFSALKPGSEPTQAVEEETGWSKKNPFPAKLLTNRGLNSPESSKDTRHIEFSLAGSGLDYEVGDALGLYPENCPKVVTAVMERFGLNANETVNLHDGRRLPLHEALRVGYEIRALLHKEVTFTDTASFLEDLRKLQPRLYSISSSPKAHPNEVHLTVGVVRYEENGMVQHGVASTYLADRLELNGTAGVFIHKANHFRLPSDPSKPIIMVGPGTGIAPFRAFLEEREATGATGKNWLFFGDQRAATDFLYASQLETWKSTGFLTELDLAFSRDQAEKIYVQTKMLAKAASLWAWLEAGAHFYVCGDASRMAKDVETALLAVIRSEGGKSSDQATAYLDELKKSKRYQRDVY